MADIQYSYRFTAYPDETWGLPRAVYDLFRAMGTRVELTFNESEFNTFRSALARSGITLREVERVPYCEPEAVD